MVLGGGSLEGDRHQAFMNGISAFIKEALES